MIIVCFTVLSISFLVWSILEVTMTEYGHSKFYNLYSSFIKILIIVAISTIVSAVALNFYHQNIKENYLMDCR